MADLSGKKALVTGGARGIGAAIAKRLAADGADVAITYAGRDDAAREVAQSIEATGRKSFTFKADAGDADEQAQAVGNAVEALGGLDILVHNAGIARMAPIGAEPREDFARVFAVNVGGVAEGTRAAVERLSDGGRIIIVGSVSGHSAMFPGSATYGATKAAVAGLARGWARDLAPRGILVNVVQPGPIATDLNPIDGEFSKVLLPLIPLARYGRTEEVAGVVSFLAGEDATFITGTTIDVDGGLTV